MIKVLLSAIAAALHVGEAIQAFFLASFQYNLNPLVVLLWTLNVFFFGIFGFWPLAFPQVAVVIIMMEMMMMTLESMINNGMVKMGLLTKRSTFVGFSR